MGLRPHIEHYLQSLSCDSCNHSLSYFHLSVSVTLAPSIVCNSLCLMVYMYVWVSNVVFVHEVSPNVCLCVCVCVCVYVCVCVQVPLVVCISMFVFVVVYMNACVNLCTPSFSSLYIFVCGVGEYKHISLFCLFPYCCCGCVSVFDRVWLSVYLSFSIYLLCVSLFVRVWECANGLARQRMDASVSMYVHLLFFNCSYGFYVTWCLRTCESYTCVSYTCWGIYVCVHINKLCLRIHVYLRGGLFFVVLSVWSFE
jgi:hypothetical protein